MSDWIDESFLEEVGIKLSSKSEVSTRLEELMVEFESRVGNELIKKLSEEQVDEFEELMKNGDELKNLEWLENNYPDYQDVVKREFERFKLDLKNGINN